MVWVPCALHVGSKAQESETSPCQNELICHSPRSRLQSVLISRAWVQPALSASATATEITQSCPLNPAERESCAICTALKWSPSRKLCCWHEACGLTSVCGAGRVPASAWPANRTVTAAAARSTAPPAILREKITLPPTFRKVS